MPLSFLTLSEAHATKHSSHTLERSTHQVLFNFMRLLTLFLFLLLTGLPVLQSGSLLAQSPGKSVTVMVQDCPFSVVVTSATCQATISVTTNTDYQLTWSVTPLQHTSVSTQVLNSTYVITSPSQTPGTLLLDPDTGADQTLGAVQNGQTPAWSATLFGPTASYVLNGTASHLTTNPHPKAGTYAAQITIAITPF